MAQLRSWPVHAVSAHLADFDQFMAVSGSVRLATRRRWSATAAQESATTNALTRGPETSSAVVVRCPAIKLCGTSDDSRSGGGTGDDYNDGPSDGYDDDDIGGDSGGYSPGERTPESRGGYSSG